MEAFKNSLVAILDRDPEVCENAIKMIRSWELRAEGFTVPAPAVDKIKENCCDVVLVDIVTCDLCGLNLLPQFGNDKKIIVMTESAEKETAVQSLKSGAFDLIEKPLNIDLLRHSILTALKTLENERKSKRLMADLEQNRSQLLDQKQRLEHLNAQLLDTNRALSVFAENLDRERGQMEKLIGAKLKSILVPVVAMMKDDQHLQDHRSSLDMLVMQIEELASGSHMNSGFETALSSTEMRIACFVKHGVSTEEIARQLHISESTVRTHRKNIRRKLNINARYSLRNFLTSKTGPRKQNLLNKTISIN